MKINDVLNEEKVRLDPKCWKGKKIGNPKTKMKGGVRVNNCVPAESVAETKADPTSTWVVYDGNKVKRFKTHQGAKAYAEQHGGKVASSAHYADKIQGKQGVAEAANPAQQAAIAIAMKKKGQKPKNENAEYDDEAGMADNNLETLKRAVQGIDNIIQPGDNLPEWCQEKIAVAKSMLVAVWDYMASEEDRGAETELAEEFDMIERIIEGIAAQNGVDAEVVWTDLESLTEDELYAFAVTSQLNEDWQKVNKKDKTDGMSQKAVNAYRREHPGSKLKTAVTTKPSKLKKGSKASKRRKSYCSRSRGQMKMHHISCAKTPDKAICKARRRWNC